MSTETARQATATTTSVTASSAVVSAEAASSRLSPIRPRIENVATCVPGVTRKIAMLRFVMQLMNVAVQAATQAGEDEPQVHIPQDAEPRRAQVSGSVRQVPVDLGRPALTT